jgi:hypothetical protein
VEDPFEGHATRDQIDKAVADLSDEDIRYLHFQATKLAFGTIYGTGEALFGEAILRMAELSRKWYPAKLSFVKTVRNTMASLSSNDRTGFNAKHISNVSALSSSDDALDASDDEFLTVLSNERTPALDQLLIEREDREAVLRDYDQVHEFFKRDAEVWAILHAIEEGCLGAAIQAHCQLDDAKYLAARKRLQRGKMKLKSQRKES